ncbi:single-stranded DNA-binding protein [Treponema sp. OMZ 840]|uniref:single-stranded DNA-binding protein n=1 Tax=Treponema sp. OMZ 840 TaxID=244313 RepID=UPI003D909A62
MTDLNHVMLIGRLTRDAELKYTANGFAISNFSIAVNRRRKNGEQWVEEANFFDITLYGKSAESLKQYLIKGKQIAVDGELRQDRWEQDGQPRSRVVIAANNVQLLGGGSASGSGSYNAGAKPSYDKPAYNADYPVKNEGPNYDNPPVYGGNEADFPEDIPF